MKIFHIADIHASAKTLEQVKRCTGFVSEQAVIHRPELIIIAGDIYDSRDIRLDSDTCRYIFNWIKDLSQMSPVFIVKGTPTHEGNAIKPLKVVSGKHPVIVADYPGTWAYFDYNKILPVYPGEYFGGAHIKALISAMPTPTKQFLQVEDQEISSALTPIFAGFGNMADTLKAPHHIHVGHYCVRGAAISETQTMIGKDIEIGLDQIELAKPDLVCLGHIHMAQEIDPDIYYSGSLIRKNHGEDDEKGFFIHTITHMGRSGLSFYKTPADRLLRIREDYTTINHPLVDVDTMLARIYPSDTLKDAILKIELTFWQDEHLEYTRDSIKKLFDTCGCQSVDVQIIRKPRENIRSQEILKAESLGEKVQLLADQNKEELTPGIKNKCDMLETMNREGCISQVRG